MPRTESASTTAPLPDTIAGLWGLCALVPLKSRAAYGDAADLCARLSVRRLNAAQREYFRELLAMVENYEDAHQEPARALAGLRKAAAGSAQKALLAGKAVEYRRSLANGSFTARILTPKEQRAAQQKSSATFTEDFRRKGPLMQTPKRGPK